jgi:hypothetical protein
MLFGHFLGRHRGQVGYGGSLLFFSETISYFCFCHFGLFLQEWLNLLDYLVDAP